MHEHTLTLTHIHRHTHTCMLTLSLFLYSGPRCRDGSEPVNCFADPCEVSSCPAFPNARCVANFCGGCNATYFDENGNDVTSRCRGTINTVTPVHPYFNTHKHAQTYSHFHTQYSFQPPFKWKYALK